MYAYCDLILLPSKYTFLNLSTFLSWRVETLLVSLPSANVVHSLCHSASKLLSEISAMTVMQCSKLLKMLLQYFVKNRLFLRFHILYNTKI